MKIAALLLPVFFLVVSHGVIRSAGKDIGQRTHERERERNRMVSRQIAARGIKDEKVLSAMRRVQRHLLIPERYRKAAYEDHPVPIGYGQTISQPYIVAYMTETLKLDRNAKVLEIGTGSGYQAAVLAEITTNVYSMEIIPQLAQSAARNLVEMGYTNIRLKESDGYYGWRSEAPWDAIIVTAAAEHIPPALVGQLKPAGRMCIPVGSRFGVQYLLLVTKNKNDQVTTRNLMPVRFVPLTRKKR